MEILKEKLKRDLTSAMDEYQTKSSRHINPEWIRSTIDILVSNVEFPFPKTEPIHPDKCKARIWANKLGGQCTHNHVKGDYCKKHQQLLYDYGVLRFGDIRKPKPKYDLIKQNQEPLPWEPTDPIYLLEQVLQLQARKIIVASPHLIVH